MGREAGALRHRPVPGVQGGRVVTLHDATDRYRAALTAHEEATANQAIAHAAHVATMPLVGRVRLGNGSETTRKAHHAACEAVAATRAALHTPSDELVAAALAHECVS